MRDIIKPKTPQITKKQRKQLLIGMLQINPKRKDVQELLLKEYGYKVVNGEIVKHG